MVLTSAQLILKYMAWLVYLSDEKKEFFRRAATLSLDHLHRLFHRPSERGSRTYVVEVITYIRVRREGNL